MSYEAKLDYYQRFIEPELIRQQQAEHAEEKANLNSLEANMPPEKMQRDCELRKVAGGINESA